MAFEENKKENNVVENVKLFISLIIFIKRKINSEIIKRKVNEYMLY